MRSCEKMVSGFHGSGVAGAPPSIFLEKRRGEILRDRGNVEANGISTPSDASRCGETKISLTKISFVLRAKRD